MIQEIKTRAVDMCHKSVFKLKFMKKFTFNSF